MPRTLVMTVLLSSLAIAPVFAQDAATDATTPMDRAAGNQVQEPDRTLSNAEVRRLQNNAASGPVMAPAQAGVPAGETITPVAPAGQTTTTHDDRMDITAPEAGGPRY